MTLAGFGRLRDPYLIEIGPGRPGFDRNRRSVRECRPQGPTWQCRPLGPTLACRQIGPTGSAGVMFCQPSPPQESDKLQSIDSGGEHPGTV